MEKARFIKCNPDPSQIPVRLRALHDGKKLWMPVPELKRSKPFVLLDPLDLKKKDISFEIAATSQGAIELGQPVDFTSLPEFDLIIVGCVAVTQEGARIGKGAGFADVETAIFQELGILRASTPIVTTIHSVQILGQNSIEMNKHDFPLDWIFTEGGSIKTETAYKRPTGIYWNELSQEPNKGLSILSKLKSQ
jgi:5-formyltetrahydrofolate cyclo-ligase